MRRRENQRNFSPSPYFNWRHQKEMNICSSIFIRIMKMRRRENSRKFSSSLHLLSKMRRREIYSLGGVGSASRWGEGRIKGIFPLLPIYLSKWGEVKNSLIFSLLLILIGGIPKEIISIFPISISIMKMRRRENPREFFSSLHLLLKMGRRGIIPRIFPSPHFDWSPPPPVDSQHLSLKNEKWGKI